MSLADVVAFHDFQSVRRRMTFTQELQPVNAVVRIDQRLRGNSSDVTCDERHQGSSCKKSGSHCHSQLTGYFVPCHHRPSHRYGTLSFGTSERIQVPRLEFSALIQRVLNRRYLIT